MQLNNIKISSCGTFHQLDGNALYDKRFNAVEKFHKPGLAPVLDNTGGYHINFDGSAAYLQRFHKTFGFYCTKAAVIDGNQYYHIDSKGNKIYQDYYDWIGNYQENICVVRKGNQFFHIDKKGNKIYPEKYDYVGDFKNDIAVIYKDQKASHINNRGQLIHNQWYKKLGIYHKGYANAEDDSGWFHIDIKGNPIYSARYKMVEPFYNGYAKIETFLGELGQIDISGQIKHVIYVLNSTSLMHQISGELVGFWHTYLINAAVEMGILQLVPASTEFLAKKLNVNQKNLHRLLRALWEINLISYDKQKNIWILLEKGQFLIDTPFMFKATKMWGRVISEKNWLKIPELLKSHKITSFPSFKEKEKQLDIQTDLYQALLGYTTLDTKEFINRIDIHKDTKTLLLGVHSLALVQMLKDKGINSISYYNEPELPKKVTKDFDIEILTEGPLTKQYELAIFGRFLQHQDDNKTLFYLRKIENSKISRILLIETIIGDESPIGGAVDINIMVETGGKLRTVGDWETILKQIGDWSIHSIISLTNYLSVIDIRRK